MAKKFFSALLSKPNGGFLTPEAERTGILTKNVTKRKKNASFVKKC